MNNICCANIQSIANLQWSDKLNDSPPPPNPRKKTIPLDNTMSPFRGMNSIEWSTVFDLIYFSIWFEEIFHSFSLLKWYQNLTKSIDKTISLQ